jgi:hypothetical protein
MLRQLKFTFSLTEFRVSRLSVSLGEASVFQFLKHAGHLISGATCLKTCDGLTSFILHDLGEKWLRNATV